MSQPNRDPNGPEGVFQAPRTLQAFLRLVEQQYRDGRPDDTGLVIPVERSPDRESDGGGEG